MIVARCPPSGEGTTATVVRCKWTYLQKPSNHRFLPLCALAQLKGKGKGKGKGKCSCIGMTPSSWLGPSKTLRVYSLESADGAPFSARISAARLVQGTAGLVLIAGSLGMAAKFMWQKASQVASLPPSYEATLEFPFASGITIGTVLRIRGVEVGSVIGVRPCLERIDAHIKVMDSMSYIPRNALVEVNQSGLVGETIIDITPMSPIPQPVAGPLDPGCPSEGLIVCQKERMKGQQGVSMDDLIRLCGKMSRNTQETDVRDLFDTAERFKNAFTDSKLVLEKLEKFVTNIEPVAKEINDHKLLRSLQDLLKQASLTIYTLRKSKFMMEPRKSFADSISNLAETLNAIENTSVETSNFFKAEKNRRKIKLLVEVLSRLVDESHC